MTQQTINYAEEAKMLLENSTYWKPKQGKYLVVFLEEPENDEYIDDKGKVTPQWKLKVSVDGGLPQMWTMSRSNSPSSLRGQLIKIGAKKGLLKGNGTQVIVMGEGRDKKYTLPDAL